jgi:arylsulfatase A-like enzyme
MKKRNILLIMTDQQRFDTIEALGNPIIRTPALNDLVEKGISFTRAYSPCPVCVPARMSLLTGQLPHRTGCVDNTPSEYRESLMQILSRNGYQTMGAGKMHFTMTEKSQLDDHKVDALLGKLNKLTEMWGFEKRATSECDEMDDYKSFIRSTEYSHVPEPSGERSEMYYIPQPSQLPAKYNETAWVTDRSIDYLKNRDSDRPFFLMTSFQAPHPPFVAPFPWNKIYRSADMPLPKMPDDFDNLLTLWNRYQNRYKYMDQGVNKNLLRTLKAYYYAMITFIDYNLGRLFEYMASQNLMEDTLILFTSDHGEMLGDYNSFGKRCFLDSAARIPLLMRSPDGEKCLRNETPVSLVDILPTILEFAEIDSPDSYSGESLFDIVHGRRKRDAIYGQFQREGLASYMMLDDQYKYIYSAPDQREWLFHSRRDKDETRSIAENTLYLGKTEEMRNRMIRFFREEGYLDPIDGDGWKQYPLRTMPRDPDACLLYQDAGDFIPQKDAYRSDANTMKYFRDRWYE